MAFDRANMIDSAIVSYNRYVTSPQAGRGWNSDGNYLPWILKRLGELYEQQGDAANAARVYRRYVELWKNADPELQPKVAEVRRRIARLSDVERR